ncbi:hypothetical protein TSUD_256450 [Trifolium subterraneum]|uniref:Uncharacterized protein n=1 Tax=Trifolium subterraneum TaxID=3900 RepID=A0A2Z6NFL0_TRISU|nr:hypothetical protein TSUD_256450 [Trifolium subterraneum]
MQKPEFEPSLGNAAQLEDIQQSQTSQSQDEAKSYPSFPLESENNNIIEKKFELNAQKYEQQDDPYSDSSFPSDGESSAGSIIDESFDIDLRRNQDMSLSDSFATDDDEEDDEEDDSGEDEEEDGLIEINLPSSNFSSLNEEYSKQNLDFIFKEEGLMDLLAEINEDENLIEIDIFNGSTKYQDFRFKELACLGDQCF